MEKKSEVEIKDEEKLLLFKTIKQQIQEMINTGEKAELVDDTVFMNFKRRKKRLKEYGLSVEIKLVDEDVVRCQAENGCILSGENGEDDQTVYHTVYSQEFMRRRIYRCGGKKVKNINDKAKLSVVLEDKGTRENWKVIENFWSDFIGLSAANEKKRTKIAWGMVGVLVLFYFIVSLCAGWGFEGGFFIGGMIAMFFGVFFIFWKILYLIVDNIVTSVQIAKLYNANKQQMQTMNNMKQNNPELNITYIENVAVELWERKAFEENNQIVKDIIDTKYDDCLRILDYKKGINSLKMVLELDVTNTVIVESKIRQKKEIIYMEMEHQGEYVVSEELFARDKFERWEIKMVKRQLK